MLTFIQTLDNIGFALVRTHGEPDHSVTPDDTTAINVTNHPNPESLLGKKYDPVTKTWSEAPLFYFVTQLINGVVHQTNSTVFKSHITGDEVPVECGYGWVKNDDGSYSAPSEPTFVTSTVIEPSQIEAPTGGGVYQTPAELFEALKKA
jgi:hypothetical protein